MSAIDNYYAALNRLKQNKPERVKKGSQINKDTVALEAGNKRGAIRNRPEFFRLIESIKDAANSERAKVAKTPNRYKRRAETLSAKLKIACTDKDMAQSRYMSLLYLNYQLAKKLSENNIDPPQFGTTFDFDLDSKVKL